ncbi:MAG: hypothetical protein HZA50_08195 [Planctomycetes bacterium]|nr:hypothetical protein [Planctomycetota bacterium]
MKTGEMTNRERIFTTIEGGPIDRFPVWLKMANPTWMSSQPEPYRSMSDVDLLRAAGCDLMVSFGMPASKKMPHVRATRQEADGTMTLTYTTPDGELVLQEKLDPYTNSWHPVRFPADSPENFRLLRWLFADTSFSVDPQRVQAGRDWRKSMESQEAFTCCGIGPGPLMNLVEHLCGPENTVFLMADEPDLFRQTLALMHEDRMRELRAILPSAPADTFWLTENTSTSLISPAMFEEFCVPHLRDYGNLILEHGIIPVHHMCGLLNALLEMIDALPARCNEAYTTRPLGNVSLAEGRKRMPSKSLIGGTNATLWMQPAEEIVRTVAEDLANCPDRRKIFLTSAGVLPPMVSMEKATQVVAEFKRL